MGTPRPRLATTADAAALVALSPALVPGDSPDRAVFVIDGDGGPVAAIDLRRMADHISIEHLVAGRRETRRLVAHAEAAARAMGLGEVRWPGYRGARKRIARGPVQRAADHLETLGVPLWRDGTAALAQTLFVRGTWAALALLIGLGSVSLAVFSGLEITWAHIVVPGLLSVAGAVFAIWQIGLLAVAARRTAGRMAFAATAGAAAAATLAVGGLVHDRAAPSLTEMWKIHAGDVALNDLAVAASADGRTLHVEGSYGVRSEQTVQRALDRYGDVRTVVLAGPGGRASVGFDLYRLFQARRLATRVDGGCASACTIAFLGGVDRSISPGGRLGFHRASFPGMGESDMYESNRGLRRFLIYGARVTPAFAGRVLDTPPDAIWVPTPEELLAGRVINRVNR